MVRRSDKTSKVTLVVNITSEKTENRIFNNVNPGATDEKVYYYFSSEDVPNKNTKGLGYFSSYSVNTITRTNSALLSE